MILRLIFTLIFTLSSFAFFAQEYIVNVEHYNLVKGLETRNIQNAYKDSEGYMWFCTDKGAYRFDGYEFKLFHRNIGTEAPFYTNKMTEDDEKNLWFIHPNRNNGIGEISVLPHASDTLISFQEFFREQFSFPIEDIIYYSMNFTSSGFWFGNKKGEIYEYADGEIKKLFVVPKYIFEERADLFPLQIHRFKNKNWVNDGKNLYKVSSSGAFEKQDSLNGFFSQVDTKGRFWFFGSSETLFKENENAPLKKAPFKILEEEKFENRILSNNFPYLIAKRGNRLSDFILLNHSNGEIIDFAKLGLSNEIVAISNYFFENENTLWLCTYFGIYQIQFNKNPFFQYMNGISTRGIIRGDNDEIWIQSYSGLFEIDPSKNNVSQLIDEKIKGGQCFYKDNQNKYWSGHSGGTITKFSNVDSILAHQYKIKNKNRSVGDIYILYQDKVNNNLFAGTKIGLYSYHESLDSFIFYPKINEFEIIEESNIRDFEPINNSKKLLIASNKGIFQLDYDEGITHHFCSQNNTFPFDNITYIHTDQEDGTLWIGTNQGGLFHWDFPSDKPQRFTTKNGLVDNMIYSIHEDEKGFLWLPSNNGLMRFNKSTNEVNIFTTKDGIAHNEFNFQSNFQDKDGTIYLGGLNGVTSFHPNNINLTECNVPIYLSNIETPNLQTGEMISTYGDFNQRDGIHLASNEQAINLSFAMLNYNNQDKNKFAYRLEGLENNWQNIEGHSVRFPGLPYGKYSLWVKGKNAYGQWSSEILKIPIEIVQPFYKAWWFLILTTLISILMLATLFSNQRTAYLSQRNLELEEEVSKRTEELRKDKEVIEKQADELQKLDALKTQFFANVTHELRTPLALIIGPLKHLMNTTQLDQKTLRTLNSIAQNGENLKELVEEILDLSRYDLNKLKLNKQPVYFISEMKKLAAGFDLKAEQLDIDFQLFYQVPIDIHLNIDSRKVRKIVTNLLTNAFKFIKSGDSILLHVLEHENKIHVKVIDTGKGISEEELSKVFDRFYQSKENTIRQSGGLGIGLSLAKDLAKLMQGSLSATSTIGKGSTFTLIFPKEETKEKITQQQEMETLIEEVNQDIIPISKNNYNNTVLIVEDNIEMQNFIEDLLSPQANIITANNGKKALQVLSENDNVDLIISDVMMPEMDGFTLLEKLKSDNQLQLIPVILLTALIANSNRAKAITFGVDDYLTKPFEPEELIALVSNLLENVNLRKAESQEDTASNDDKIDSLPLLESANLKWLKKLETLAFEKVTSPNFNINQIAHEMAIGERQFSRKVKKITGMTAGSYLKEIKLQKARQLLESKAYDTVSEISYIVGFNTAQYFSKLYRKRFGKLPSDYLKD